MFFVDFDYNWIFLLSGIIYFIIMYNKYRNSGARHKYEVDTKREISNLNQKDDFVRIEKGLSNSMIQGANNKKINGDKNSVNTSNIQNFGTSILNNAIDNNALASFVKNNVDKKEK